MSKHNSAYHCHFLHRKAIKEKIIERKSLYEDVSYFPELPYGNIYFIVLVYYSKTVGTTSRTSKRHKVIIIEEKTAKALL